MYIVKKSVPLAVMSLLLFALAACVRPYPQEQPADDNSDQGVATQPVIQPITPVITPLETAVAQPTVESVQPTVEIVITADAPSETIHTVQAGDTLFKIASQYGVTIDVITSVNEIPNINQLEIGQQLVIPGPDYVLPVATVISTETTPVPDQLPDPPQQPQDGTHIVQAGENLYRIGLRYGCTTQELAAANGITNPDSLAVGQVLNIPDCS